MKAATAFRSFLLALVASAVGLAQVASFALFHASADPELQSIDVYYDDNWVQLGLPFRQLSVRQDVLAGVSYRIGIAPSEADTLIATQQWTPQSERDYLMVFLGLGTPDRFAPNPDGLPTRARILIHELPITVEGTGQLQLSFVHAVTDAPAVRLQRANGQPLYPATGFGSLSTQNIPADTLTIELYTFGGTLVARFRGDLRPFEGEAGLLVLSGFVQPSMNRGGPSLALHAVFRDGTVIEFQQLDTQAQTASIQLIHASPDPQLALVDVYVNGDKVLDDFGFRSATGLRELPAGVPLVIGIAPGNSQSVADTLRSFRAVLPTGAKLCAIVCGVLSPQNFAPNPDGRSIELTVLAFSIQEQASSTTVRLATAHAVTDASAVTLRFGATTLAQDLHFAEFASYQEVAATSDTLRGLPQEYLLDLSSSAGKSGVLLLSGFANPMANGNGPAVEPLVVFTDGSVLSPSPVTGLEQPGSVAEVQVRLSAEEGKLWVYVPIPLSEPLAVELFTLTGQRLGSWLVRADVSGWQPLPLAVSPASGVYLCRLGTPKRLQLRHFLVPAP